MSDFKLVNIPDANLEDIASEITIPVISGSSSNNFQTFNAQTSVGTTQLQYNIPLRHVKTSAGRHHGDKYISLLRTVTQFFPKGKMMFGMWPTPVEKSWSDLQ